MDYRQLIQNTRRGLRRQGLKTGALWCLLMCLVLVGAMGALGLSVPRREVRTVYFLCGSVAGIAVLVRYLLIPGVVSIPDSKVIQILETRYPQIQGRLYLANYFDCSPDEVEKLGYSTQLQAGIMGFAGQLPPEFQGSKTFDAWETRRLRFLVLVILLADVLLFSFQPGAFLEGWAGTRSLFEKEVRVHRIPGLLVQAPDHAAKGSPVRVLVSGAGLGERIPRFHFRNRDGSWSQVEMEKTDASHRYAHQIAHLVRSTTFCITAGPAISEVKTIKALDRPHVVSFLFGLEYPPYMGMQDKKEHQLDGNLIVPQGTRVTMQIKANNPLDLAYVSFIDGRKIPMEVEGQALAKASFEVIDSTRYQILLKDQYGLSVDDAPFYQILAQPDKKPMISFISPAVQVMDIPDTMQLEVSGQAEDDFGLTKGELVYQVGYDQPQRVLEMEMTPLRMNEHPENASATVADLSCEWNLQAVDLLPGESISYWLRVFDNDPIQGPKEGRSGVQIIRFPSLFEIYEEIQEEELEQVESTQDILEQQKALRKETEDFRETVDGQKEKQSEEVSWEHKKTLENLKSRQEEIQQEIQEIQEEYQDTFEQLREDTALSSETMEKISKIQEIIDKMLTQEMKDTLNRFNQALESMDLSQLDKQLEKLDFSMEKFEKSLDRTLSLLQQSYVEKNLQRLACQAEQLAKSQQEILERTQQRQRGDPMDDLARRQEQLEKSVHKFIEDASQLSKEAENVNPELKKNLEQMVDKAQRENLEKNVRDAKEQLAKGDKQKATESEKKAQETLAEMSACLKRNKESMMGMSITFDVLAWHRLMDRVFFLSERQEQFDRSLPEGLQTGLSRTMAIPLNDYAVLQSIYGEEAGRVASEVEELASKNPFIDTEVVDLLRNMKSACQQWARTSKEGFGHILVTQSKHTLGLANMTIAKMLEVLDSMMSMAASSSMEGFFQMMEQMVQQQQQINEMTERLDGTNRDKPEWMEQLQQMVQQQQMVRQAMQQMRDKYQHMQDLLGNLSELGKEMQEVEDLLRAQETGKKVQEKQARLLQRMLDAEKSVRAQEDKRKRKSEIAKELEQTDKPSSLEGAKSWLRKKALENKARLNREGILPEYRNLLKNYFQRLSEQSL